MSNESTPSTPPKASTAENITMTDITLIAAKRIEAELETIGEWDHDDFEDFYRRDVPTLLSTLTALADRVAELEGEQHEVKQLNAFHICPTGNKVRPYPSVLCSAHPDHEGVIDFDPVERISALTAKVAELEKQHPPEVQAAAKVYKSQNGLNANHVIFARNLLADYAASIINSKGAPR